MNTETDLLLSSLVAVWWGQPEKELTGWDSHMLSHRCRETSASSLSVSPSILLCQSPPLFLRAKHRALLRGGGRDKAPATFFDNRVHSMETGQISV